jgi:hypothetical protein
VRAAPRRAAPRCAALRIALHILHRCLDARTCSILDAHNY